MLDAHDLISDELLNDYSLGALDYLIAHGRELEFQFQGENFFLSKHVSSKYVSLFHNEIEQAFDSMDEFFEKAKLLEQPFLEVWKECNEFILYWGNNE